MSSTYNPTSSRAPPPRPKRPYAADPLPSSTASTSSKRPRFDPRNPSTIIPPTDDDDVTGTTTDALDDAILDLDSIGRGGRGVKRGAVRLEGYDSDSSNEGYERVVEKKPSKKKTSGDDDDDDMFGGGDDEGGEDAAERRDSTRNSKKKEVRFLRLDEIEGQESDNEHEHVHISHRSSSGKGKSRETSTSESDSEEESEEEIKPVPKDIDPELGAAHSHAKPTFSAFNMKAEMTEGRFDQNGNFIRNAVDIDAIHDSWLDESNTSKKSLKKARQAHEKREELARQRRLEEDKVVAADVLRDLIGLLERGETVLEAIARLGKQMKRKKEKAVPKWKKNSKATAAGGQENGAAGATGTTGEEQDEENNKRLKQVIEKITSDADILLSRGQLEIYDATRELLMRLYKRDTGEDYVENPRERSPSLTPPPLPSASTTTSTAAPTTQPETSEPIEMWEYRWTDRNREDAGQVYGPFDKNAMAAWNQHGFFEGGGIEFRRVPKENNGGGERWTIVADF